MHTAVAAAANDRRARRASEAGLRGRDVRGTGILPNFAASGTNLVRLQSGAFDPLAGPAPAGAAIPHVPDNGLPAGVPLYFLAQVANGQFAAATNAITGAGASVVSIVPDDTYVVRATTAQRSAFKLSPRFAGRRTCSRAWRVPVAANGLPNLLDLAGRARTASTRSAPTPAPRHSRPCSARSRRARRARRRCGRRRPRVGRRVGAMAAIPFVQWVSTKPIAVPLNYDARWVVDSGVRDLFTTTGSERRRGPPQRRRRDRGRCRHSPQLHQQQRGLRARRVPRRLRLKGLNCELADFTQKHPGTTTRRWRRYRSTTRARNHRKMAAYFDLGGVGVETISADADAHGSHTAGTIDGDAGTPLVYNGQDGSRPRRATCTRRSSIRRAAWRHRPTTTSCSARRTARARPPRSPTPAGRPIPRSTAARSTTRCTTPRTHNNSYGLTIPEVDPFSEAIVLDQFVWDHEDMAIAVAAGNSGPQIGTIGSPAVAKNDFTERGVVERSPADGRDRFGHQLLVARSDRRRPLRRHARDAGRGRRVGEGRHVRRLPLPAGHVDVDAGAHRRAHPRPPVLLERLRPDRPARGSRSARRARAASTTRARRCSRRRSSSGATRMRGWYSGDDGSTLEAQQRGQYPSAGQGFGLVNLDRSLSFKGGPLTSWFHDVYRSSAEAFDVSGSATATRSYPIQVGSGAPLNLALAWTDAPDAMPAGTPTLVNDLQLTLTDPSGKVYVGNNFNSARTRRSRSPRRRAATPRPTR